MKFPFELPRSAYRSPASVGAGRSRREFLSIAGVGLAAVGAGAFLAGCADSSGSTPAPGGSGGLAPDALANSTRFVVATAPGDNFLIDQVNKEQGQFARYNLDVPKLLVPSSAVQANQLLASGAMGGCMTDITVAISAFANSTPGQRPVVVGLRVPVNTYSVVVGKGSWPGDNASFPEKMNALRGKRIGVTALGAGADQQLLMALGAVGLSERDVTRIGVGQISPAIAQLKADRIDAYLSYTRGASLAVAHQSGGGLFVNFSDADVPEVLNRQPVGAIVVREDFATSSQDVVRAWLAAQADGMTWIADHADDAAALLNKTSFDGKMSEVAVESVRFLNDTVGPSTKPMFQVSREPIELMVSIAEKQGHITPGAVRYEDLVPDYARAR
ncbi:ABC transporter substrate-binding protein [Nocardia australiensis]|uniref:ABC transporter substrate-binding protein n=1 Tax=Nocardia australiensis TaxID=2887191 RepID=UPI001D14A48B|nr:ABC transporter substrate-binding protein [Nocardia australiensis]